MVTRTAEIPVKVAAGEADCGECVERLRRRLADHDGLVAVEATGTATMRVVYDPDRCSLSCVTEAADEMGAELGLRFAHEVLPVEGMDCPDCAQTIERAVGRLDGVTACSVSFAGEVLRVEYEQHADGVAGRVRRQVAALGYQVREPAPPPGPGAAPPSFTRRWHRELRTAGAAGLLLVAVGVSAAGAHTVAVVIYLASILLAGVPVARAGLAAVRATHRPDINLLMSVAVVGAAAIGAWLEAALVVVLFAVGAALERYAVGRARRSLAELVALTPQAARVLRDLTEVEVPVSALAVGDLVVVRPGERIPADGEVVRGASAVDQAAITGESVPVDKEVGDAVFAGTLNEEGRLLVRVGRAPGDTTLDRIARAVAEAQAKKAPIERWVDAFARVYTPAVIAAAVVVAAVPPLVGAGAFADWLYRGLAFLILACPCALVVATPVAVVAALARASSAGVLVKGGAYLEAAADVRAVAFDKTGTLTAGRPRVTKVVPLDARTDRQVLHLAASLEAASEHPLARAIVDAARRWNIEPSPVEEFAALRGIGVEATLDGRRVRVGKPALFASHPGLDGAAATITRLEREGRTVAVVGTDERLAGLVALNDTVRPTARAALDALRSLGVERTVLLTGDHGAAARAIMGETGIDEVRSDLLPEQKVDAVAELEAFCGSVAMVGDGVNDAPALVRSSLGVAMGSAGSPTAIETADVALMGDDPAKLAGLVGLARWTKAVVRQNIAFSLATKAVAAAFALVGLLPLWVAVLADVGATLLVVANGLRLLAGHPGGRLRGLPLLEPVWSRT